MVMSCADAIAKVLEECTNKEEINIPRFTVEEAPVNMSTANWTAPNKDPKSGTRATEGSLTKASNPSPEMCPECLSFSIIYAEGCRKCTNCGFTECS
jgi:hypothetical protein